MSKALQAAIEALASFDPRKGKDARAATGVPRRQTADYLSWVHGVLRHRRTLGVVLGAVAKRALKKRQPQTVAALQVLGFRLLYLGEGLDDVLAAFDATAPSKKSREHVARVLGALNDAIGERLDGQHAGDDALLPVSRTGAVRFTRPLLEVSNRNLAGRLGIVHSLPDDLVDAWVRDRGEEVARQMCWAANDPPPLFGRVQPLKTDLPTLTAALAEAGVTIEPRDVPGSFCLTKGRGGFRHSQAFKDGWFTIQDLTAQRPAHLLAPRPGERVLDLCAAPGGKTTALAELAEDQADVLACDLSAKRLIKVDENARRLGLTSIRTRPCDGRNPDLDEAPFDAILVDAPCSNTGVLRRRSEARWRYRSHGQRRLVKVQAEILDAALGLLAPGGRLVYSVCSVEAEEGEALVRATAEARPNLELVDERLDLPSPEGGDGGFAALLRRA